MQSPFSGWRHHLARWEACHWIRGSQGSPMNPVPLPPPLRGALWVLSHEAMSLQESIERFILSPGWGKVRRSRIGGGERSEPICRMPIMPYDTESKSRNVLASPLGEEGHEVAKGWTVVRMVMILDVDVTAERRHYNTHCPIGQSTTLGPKGRQT